MSDYPRPFKPGPIEPVVEPGQNLLLIDNNSYKLYQVAFIEQLPESHPFVANLGAIAANTTLGADFNTNTLLDMQYGEVAQLRARVLDDINVVFRQPQGLARFSNQVVTGLISAWTALNDPCGHESETFIFEQQRLFLRGTNPTQYALVQARVQFWGFRYILFGADGVASTGQKILPLATYTSIKEAVASGVRFTAVPVGGWSR